MAQNVALMATAAGNADYFSNHQSADRFPFSLYHDPIQNDILRVIRREAEARGALRILNVGCGLSQILHRIDNRHRYLGVDVDARAVAACRERYPAERARFEVSAEYELPVEDGSQDLIFAKEVVEHVLEPERWLTVLIRALAVGGVLHLSTPNYGGWQLPFLENTLLEWVARRKGFTRA